MKKKIRLLWYDMKEMGISRFLPIVLLGGLFLFSQSLKSNPDGILRMLELFLPSICAWWIIFLFHNYVEDEGAEVFCAYPTSRRFLGIIRVLIFYFLYLVVLLVFLISMCKSGCIKWQILGLYFMQLSVQSLFYGSCGFYFILRTKSTLWSIAMILSIAALTIWGNLPIINSLITLRFYSNENMRFENMWLNMVIILCISAFILYQGQRRFVQYERYQYDVSTKKR